MERLPNILSTIRILLTPVFLVLFFEPELWIKLIALGVYIIAAITDFFDGYYARKYNIETSLGAFLDPFADKLLTLSGFAVLPFIAADQFPWWAIIAIAVRDISITLLRLWARRKNLEMQTPHSKKQTNTTNEPSALCPTHMRPAAPPHHAQNRWTPRAPEFSTAQH